MDVKTRRPLRFDALEGRVYLSVAHAGHVQGTTIKGTIQIPVSADTNLSSSLNVEGNGIVKPFGPVTALGTLASGTQGGGGIVNLASGNGGIVLDLTQTSAHNHRGSQSFRFTIVGGTGTYTHASGEGTATEGRGNGSSLVALSLRGTVHIGS